MPDPKLDRPTVERAAQARRGEYVALLRELVEIPSVSMQAEHQDDCRRAAAAAARAIASRGGQARVVETAGNPVVVGLLEGPPGAPTVTVYNHLDVQPATAGRDGWTREPFAFAEEGDRFYGRGATDDKGPAAAALLGAVVARELGVPITVRLLWEMEEEIGSPHFEPFLQAEVAGLQSDCVVVSDTLWLAKGKPAIPYGLRGLAAAMLRLETGTKEAHSGVTGGAARNPLAELCQVIAGCLDGRTGEITIEGFDKTWSPPSPDEVDDFVASGFDVAGFLRAQGFKSLRATDPREVTQRLWARPTMEIHGIAGGYQGEGIKTAIPPAAEAKVSFRLVAPQDPAAVFALLRAHVRKLNPDVQVIESHGVRAFLADRRGPVAEAAADAMEFGFGARPAFIREGGSIGAVILMEQYLKAPITLLGISLPEHGYHGPDEFFDWGQAAGGMAMFVRFFERLGALRA
jgi:acetylornithine deacetylase/succinyl-diaminopimelate desuccinylase-like protein